MLIRLNKYLSECGVGSRRAVDEMISAGEVTLSDDRVARLGEKIDPEKDIVFVRGKQIRVSDNESKKYIVLNKPKGVVSTVKDVHAEKTVLSLVNSVERLYPVGRLDKDSHGLVLLTNDGQLAFRLTHPRYHVSKTYEVLVRGKTKATILQRMRDGISIEGEITAPAEVSILKQTANETLLGVVLYEGKKREIRRMCAELHLFLLDLKRIAIGPLFLGTLMDGQSRTLSTDEVLRLKKLVQL